MFRRRLRVVDVVVNRRAKPMRPDCRCVNVSIQSLLGGDLEGDPYFMGLRWEYHPENEADVMV
jgi:hypothetical protein